MENLSRREFLKGGLALLASASIPDLKITFAQANAGPQPGDLVTVESEDRVFLLRDNKAYPIEDRATYVKNSKFYEYGGKSYFTLSSIHNRYRPEPPLERSQTLILDEFSGLLKDRKLNGGEINVYFSGFLTDEGIPEGEISLSKAFISLRRKLATQGFALQDSLFFTYGKRRLDSYHRQDTLKPPPENIILALEFFDELKKTYPYAQFNLIAHSLGGIFALEIARKNMDAINNLILINSPVGGLGRSIALDSGASLLEDILRPIGREFVTDYLFYIGQSREYQQELDRFAEEFTGRGRGLIVVTADGDPVVPRASTFMSHAKSITVGRSIFDFLQPLWPHGRPLTDSFSVNAMADILGLNLANQNRWGPVLFLS